SPLIARAASCLSQYLPVTDVAQVEMASASDSDAMARRMRVSLEAASPLGAGLSKPRAKRDSKVLALAGGDTARGPSAEGAGLENGEAIKHEAWILIPASEEGKAYGEQAHKILANVHLVRVPGQADLMFCQEQGSLSPEELERLIAPCRDAYR